MPDGSPQLTQTWVGTDGEHIVILRTQQVVDSTPKGGAESIEELAQKYLGGPYPWFGGRDQIRVVLTIAVEKIVHAPWG